MTAALVGQRATVEAQPARMAALARLPLFVALQGRRAVRARLLNIASAEARLDQLLATA